VEPDFDPANSRKAAEMLRYYAQRLPSSRSTTPFTQHAEPEAV